MVGSQAILATNPEAPDTLLVSIEADLYPRENPALADLIDGTIGELSPFHQTFGYYAHGVSPDTATLASGWEERLVEMTSKNTRGVTGWCLHPLDLAYSKLAAGRPKDLDYVRELSRHGFISRDALDELIDSSASTLRSLLLQSAEIVFRE